MGIKTYNPYTPSRRNMTGSDFSEITKTTPEKSLTTSLKKNAGRNNQGKITVRHHGGGNRRIQNHRFQEKQQRRDSCNGNRHRVRSEQNGKHRADLLCGRREGLYPCSAGLDGRYDRYERRPGRGSCRKLPAA